MAVKTDRENQEAKLSGRTSVLFCVRVLVSLSEVLVNGIPICSGVRTNFSLYKR
jgi:hypothetical protein